MQELIEFLVEQITGKKLAVEKTESEGLEVYTIKSPKDLMGILIGKSGRTIRAIRALARTRAIVDNKSISVQLEEAIS
ncbi:MAG: KH domain-containing protein [bacterium]|nr:KH domain-containing protein [bacterium]